MNTVKEFLDKKSQEIGYVDFYNFLIKSDIERKYFLIPKWIEDFSKN